MNTVYQFIDFILPFEWIQYNFMKNAFLALLLSAPLFGSLGSMVVAGKMAFFSDALGHGAFTGVAIGVILGVNIVPSFSAIIFSIFFAIMITWVKRKSRSSSDTVIGVFSSTAAAVGIALLSRNSQLNRYSSTLTGDILSVSGNDIFYLFFLSLLISIIWILISNKMFFLSLDMGLAKSRSVNTSQVELIFTIILAALVASSINWIGLLLINSFLVLPAATSRLISVGLKSYHFLSVVIALFCALLGLILSYYLNIATGSLIVLLCAICYFSVLLIKTLLRRKQYV